MCHEATGRALTAAIGSGKGTVDVKDWEQADAIFLMGDNAATNAPRMLTWLAEADRRGAQLVHINPLLEAASRRTIVPHEFVDMATFHTTEIGTMNVQVRIGGDLALVRGVSKAVFEAAAAGRDVLDREFIERCTQGVDEYRALCEATPWADLTRDSGVDEPTIRKLADVYMASERVIIAWCLGLAMDVADATVFGQHALAYTVLAYAAEYFRRRVLRFPLWQQAAQVVLLLLLCAVLEALVRIVGGAALPQWTYLVSPMIAALLWPALSVLFQAPQQPRRSDSEL